MLSLYETQFKININVHRSYPFFPMPRPVALTRPHACELPCMLVLHGLPPDWITAGFETLLRVRVEKGQLYVSAQKVRTGRREGDAAFCKSVRRTFKQAAGAILLRHIGFRMLFWRSTARLPPCRSCNLHSRCLGPDFQSKSLGELCPNFRSSSPHQIGASSQYQAAFLLL